MGRLGLWPGKEDVRQRSGADRQKGPARNTHRERRGRTAAPAGAEGAEGAAAATPPPWHPLRAAASHVTHGCGITCGPCVPSRDRARATAAVAPLWRLCPPAFPLVGLGWVVAVASRASWGWRGPRHRVLQRLKRQQMWEAGSVIAVRQRLPGHSILCTFRSELGEGGTPSPIRSLLWSLPGTGSCHCVKCRTRELNQLRRRSAFLLLH